MGHNKSKVRVDRIVVPYVYLFNAAFLALEQAKTLEGNPFYNCLSCVLLSTLSIEAYLNHIGRAYFKSWEELERNLTPRQKLTLIQTERLRVSFDFEQRPFQSFIVLFKFRNQMAHGKTQNLSVIRELQDLAETPEEPLTD